MAVRADMINKALSRMGLRRGDATVTGARSTDLGLAYDEVYEELEEELLVDFASDGTVPNKIVNPIVALMCRARLDNYKTAPSRQRLIIADTGENGEIAKKLIRKMGRGPIQHSQTKFQDF